MRKPPAGSILREIGVSRPYPIVLIHGDTGCGKTTIPTDYCPSPVNIYNFDGRAEPAVEKARRKGRDVLHAHIPCPIGSARVPEDQAKKTARDAIDLLHKELAIAYREVEKGNCRTVAIDTGTELSEIYNLSVTGKFEDTKGDHGQSKGVVNLIWRRMIIDMRKVDCHFVILARSKEVWMNNKPTGAFVPRGPSVMEESADFVMQVRRLKRERDVQFSVKMTNPKLDMSQMGEVYTPDDWGELGPYLYACLLQGIDVDMKL